MPSLMERVQNLPWICVDTSGKSQDIQMDKVTMMCRFDLPASDFLLLDPSSDSPSAILVREKAIVVKLEQIGCIITADEVLLLSPHRPCVMQYVAELQRRLNTAGVSEVSESECADLSRRRGRRNFDNNSGNSSPEYLPFEFRALEVALQAASTFLHSQVSEFEEETENLFVEIDSMIVTWQLAKVRSLKSKLAALTRRLQMVRDEIERLVNDKGKMADMYLAEKKRRMESTSYGYQSLLGNRSTDGALSVSAPVSPVASPPDGRNSRHNSTRSSEISRKSTQLEMLLETYFVLINTTLNKVPELKEVIDDIGFFINIEQDSVRNKLIRFELLMITATFIVAIFGVVAGIFGMNFPVPLFHNAGAFKWVLIITGAIGITIFLAFYCFFKYRRLMLQ